MEDHRIEGMVIMETKWIDEAGNLYEGDCRPGDREATDVEVAEWEAARPPEYRRLRAAEYPPITDYLDGIVKGDRAQVDSYISRCQAVKAKYPK